MATDAFVRIWRWSWNGQYFGFGLTRVPHHALIADAWIGERGRWWIRFEWEFRR